MITRMTKNLLVLIFLLHSVKTIEPPRYSRLHYQKSCGVVYFVHLPKSGGSAVTDYFYQHLGRSGIFDYDYFSTLNADPSTLNRIKSADAFKTHKSDPSVYHNWVKQVDQIEGIVKNYDRKRPANGWSLIHQQSFTPGLKYSMSNITRWRRRIEKLGCKFVLLTVLQQPVKRMISHLHYFLVEHADVKDYVTGYGANFMLKSLLYGECDYSFDIPRCYGENMPTPTFSDLQYALDIVNQFDVIGTIEEFDQIRTQLDVFTGRKGGIEIFGLPHMRVAQEEQKNASYVLMEDEMQMLTKFGTGLDQIFYDKIAHKKDVSQVTQRSLYPNITCYVERYPDLFEAYCDFDEDKCKNADIYNHYVKEGKQNQLTLECRSVRDDDLICYAQRYEDLFKGFCDEDENSCDLDGLYNHYNENKETLNLVMGCKPEDRHTLCYADRYPDLKESFCTEEKCDVEELFRHWQLFGQKNELVYGCIDNKDDLLCYAKRYQDVFEQFCDNDDVCMWPDLLNHWEFHGKEQGLRFGCIEIPHNVMRHLPCYVTRYKEIFDAWCSTTEGDSCDWEEIYMHWLHAGEGQGLLLDCVDNFDDLECYAKRHPDLLESYCHGDADDCDYEGLLSHWHQTGKHASLIFGCIEVNEEMREHLICYAKRHPGLYEGFCKNQDTTCNFPKLYHHWNTTGAEDHDTVFGCLDLGEAVQKDAVCYGKRYKSLFQEFCDNDASKCIPEQLYIHYKQYGEATNLRFGCGSDLRNEPNTEMDNYFEGKHEGVQILSMTTGMNTKVLNMLQSILPKIDSDANLKLTMLGYGQEWKGWLWRAQMYFDAVKNSKSNHIAIIDTDVFANTHLSSQVLLEKFNEATKGEDKVLVSVESLCCTMDMSLDKESEMLEEMDSRKKKLSKASETMFPDADFEGHVYPNFGLIMGSKPALMDLFVKLLRRMDDFSDDQTVLQQYFLEHRDSIILDHSQKVFATSDGRHENKEKQCQLYSCSEDKHLERGRRFLVEKVERPLFFHGPGDDIKCMNQLKKCVAHTFLSRKQVREKFKSIIDCSVNFDYKRPSWMSSKHRVKKSSGEYKDFDKFKCKPSQIQQHEMTLLDYDMKLLNSEGRCQSQVNSHLAFGLKRGVEDVMYCVKRCHEVDYCAGFSYDVKKKTCEYQCTTKRGICNQPSFPPGNTGGKCLVSTDHEHPNMRCYAKDSTFCTRKKINTEHIIQQRLRRRELSRRSLPEGKHIWGEPAESKHSERRMLVFGAPTALPSQPPETTLATCPTCPSCTTSKPQVATEYQRIEIQQKRPHCRPPQHKLSPYNSYWHPGTARVVNDVFYIILDNGETMTKTAFTDKFRLRTDETQAMYQNYSPVEVMNSGVWKKGFVVIKQKDGTYTVQVEGGVSGDVVLKDVPISQLRPLVGFAKNSPVTADVCQWKSGTVESILRQAGKYIVSFVNGPNAEFTASQMRKMETRYDVMDQVDVQDATTGVNRRCLVVGIDGDRNEYDVVVLDDGTVESSVPVSRIAPPGGRRMIQETEEVMATKCHEPLGIVKASFTTCEKIMQMPGIDCESDLSTFFNSATIPKESFVKISCPCTCAEKIVDRRRLSTTDLVHLDDRVRETSSGLEGKIVLSQNNALTVELDSGAVVMGQRSQFNRLDSYQAQEIVQVQVCTRHDGTIQSVNPEGKYLVQFNDNSKQYVPFSNIKSSTAFLRLWDSVSIVVNNELQSGYEIVEVDHSTNSYNLFRASDSTLTMSVSKSNVRLLSPFKL